MKKLLTILFICFAFVSNAQTVSITSSATGSVCAGTSVTFTANTSGYTTPTYQWYKNNVAISGATSSTYVTSDLVNNDAIKVAVVEGSSSVTSNGLVMNLDAGNASSYGGTGNTWTDLTGRGNNGTIPSAIVYNSANGGYFQFANSIGVVLPSASTDFNLGTSDFTIELWVNPNNSNQHRLISINGRASTNSAAFIIYGGSSGLLYSNYGTVSSGFTWGVWHHVVISRISTTCSTYVDGVLKVTTTDASSLGSNIVGSDAASTTSNTLGSFYATSSYLSYQGKMSIARVYKDVGLTSSQVIQNYNAVRSRYGLSAIGATSNSITTSVTAGPTVSINLTGDACVNKSILSASTGLSSYTWYKDDGLISGATTNTYTPSAAGAYKVNASDGTCSTTSAATTINTCGVTADGKMVSVANAGSLLSLEGGANFGTTMNDVGKILNTTGLTTTSGTIAATTAVLGGIISVTNAVTSSIGVIYSTDATFSTYSSSTMQSNVAAGTYTTTITGLTSETTYYTKSFVVNKAGTSYGPVVSFTTPARPVAIGDSYRGGIVVYIAGPSDPGYDANTTHGLIAAKVDLGSMNWNYGSRAYVSDNFFGAGIGNTAIIIAQAGTSGGNYAAKACDNYSVTETVGGITTTYDDWYLGSVFEIQKMLVNRSYLTGLLNGYYWSSSEQTATGPAHSGVPVGDALYVGLGGGADQWTRTNGSGIMGVRAIRKF